MHGWQGSFGRVSFCRAAVIAAAAVAAVTHSPAARGGVVVHRLGEQDFAHGAGPVLVEAAAAAGANEAYPFDGTVFGDDRTRKFGRLGFTYAFRPPAVPADAALTLGLLGLDSPPGAEPTVRVYFDGVEQPNAPFAGASSPRYRSSASVVTVPVAAALLADGELTVTVKAFRRSPGYPGNAIEADFAELALVDSITPPGSTPGGGEPGNGGEPGDGGEPGSGGQPGQGGEPGGGGGQNGPKPNPGPIPGGNGGGNGGGTPPPHAVPLPPAVWAGGLGLAIAAAAGRRKRR